MKKLGRQTNTPEKITPFFRGNNFSGLNFFSMVMRRNHWLAGLFIVILSLVGSFAEAANYTADSFPQDASNVPQWTRIYNEGYESVSQGILTVSTTALTSSQAYRLDGGSTSAWNPTADGSSAVVKMKVISTVETGGYAGTIMFATGSRCWVIGFKTNGVYEMTAGGAFVNLDTTNNFHVYRFTIAGVNGPLNMYVDGNPTSAATWAGSSSSANRIDFGDFMNSVGGATQWDYIHWTNKGSYPPVNMAKVPFAIAVPSSQSTDISVQVENIMDDASTFWASDYSSFPNWIEIRWAQPIYVDRITVDEVSGYLSNSYRMDVFNTETDSWQTVVGPKSNPSPGQTIVETLGGIEATKVRFYALSGYNGATQSGINSMKIYGAQDWSEACLAALPPYLPDKASFPAVSGSANYTCTSFSATPTAVVPGSKVRINLQMRKTAADAADYGFQVRIGELGVSIYKYEDYTVTLSAINPPIPTSQWVVGQDYSLSADVYIPQWAPHGNIPVIITPLRSNSRGTVTNVTDNIVGTFKIQKFATDPVPWPTTVPTTTFEIENGQANLYINGNLVSPYIMTMPDYASYQGIGEQAVPGCHLWRVLAIKEVDASYGTTGGDAENSAFFAEIDQKINNLLKVDPNAYILPVPLIRPSWAWTNRWTGDCTVLSDGTLAGHSLSSQIWKNQLDYDYRALVAHLMTQSYSGHVIGVGFEMSKETQYWGYLANNIDTLRYNIAFGDYSNAHIAAFRAWLQVKYNNNVNALKTAWNNSSVTFANAYPTISVLQQMDSTLMFKDPGITRMPMDYWEFHAEQMANMAIAAAEIIKDASGGKYITGLWGFYSIGDFAATNDPGRMLHGGWTALQKVLESPYIDYLAFIQAYTHRRSSEPMYASQLLESLLRHGKMPLIEFDVRGFFIPRDEPSFRYAPLSEPEMLSVLYDYAWGAALKGCALWWVGFPAGATNSNRMSIPWFASESVNKALLQAKVWYDAIRSTTSPSTAEVAVFMNNGDICAMDAYDGHKILVSAQYQTALFEISKLGTPVDYYELNDISLPCMSQYKVYVFLNAYNLTTAQRDAIKNVVRQTGKTAVWVYGAGYNNGTTNNVANIQDLTGIVTEVTLERRLPTVNFLSGHALTANIPSGYTLQPHKWEYDPGTYEIGPIFNVNDASAESLGTYVHNGKVAYATKMVSNSRSVFMAIPYMSSEVLRDICRVANVFRYYDGDLYLDADQHFILITNGSTAFSGSINLPQSSQVYDLWNKSILTTGATFTANIPANESRIYFYGTSAEVAAFRTQADSFPDALSYTADSFPQDASNVPQWTRIYNEGYESVSQGIFTVSTTALASSQAYRLDGGSTSAWNPTAHGSTVESKVKVISSVETGGYAGAIMLSTGSRCWVIGFQTNGVYETAAGGTFVNLNTTDNFHVYRFTIEGVNGPLKMYVDGNPAPAATWAGSSSSANRIDFGDFMNAVGGETKWDYIRWTNNGVY